MLVQAQVVALGKRGDRQSSPSGTTPSRASPIGRRIGGYDYKTESFQRPRAEHYTRFREMKNSNFFGAPSPGGRSVREITSREETERPPEESARQIPACSSLPGTESLPVTELTGSNLRHARPGAGRALVGNGETGRVQSQRNQPVTGIAYRQEDSGVRLLNRVVSQTARRATHTLSRN